MFIWCDPAQWFKAWKAEFPLQAWQVQPRLDPVGGDSALGLVPWPGSGLGSLGRCGHSQACHLRGSTARGSPRCGGLPASFCLGTVSRDWVIP